MKRSIIAAALCIFFFNCHAQASYYKVVIYGSTSTDGTNKGMFYAIKMNNAAGATAFNAAKKRVKK